MAALTRAEVEAMLAERLTAEPGYRDELLADPRGAISELIGMPIPESVHIEVHEESPKQFHLTIPTESSLSEDDLELVAGGIGGGCGCSWPG